jgi:ankyrin repeat protein
MVNIQDIEGNTALHYAAGCFSGNGEVFVPVFETLCDKGADASIRNDQGETPLHIMLATADGTINKQTISLLLAHGAKINDIDNAGNTPLHITARRLDHQDVIAFLIEQGADVTLRNLGKDTPVHIAASGLVLIPGLAEKVGIQDGVLATLTNAGGDGLMDLANAERKTPWEICQAQRDKWGKMSKGSA